MNSPPPLIRILVADDHAVVRAGLRAVIDRQRDMKVVGEATSAAEFGTKARDAELDVAVTDLRMPGGGVLEIIRDLHRDLPLLHYVVFSAYDEPVDAVQALHSGASGYVLKQAPETNLLTAIRRAHMGRRFVDEEIAARIVEEGLDAGTLGQLDRAQRLSARETAVLDRIALGYTGPQIAAELGLRIGTVETYRHRIRKKLGLKSRAEVTQFARSTGFRSRAR
jgi:DNA-binding NarL/FixJ family response regulator